MRSMLSLRISKSDDGLYCMFKSFTLGVGPHAVSSKGQKIPNGTGAGEV